MSLIKCLKNTRPSGCVFVSKGFTLVELIVTLVILGVIASIAGPRFFQTSKFTEMGYSDTVANSMRYAHKLALASGCDTRVQITSLALTLFQRASSCNSGVFSKAVKRPGGNVTWTEPVPNGVVVSALDLYFDSKGRPYSHASDLLLTSISTVSVGARVITVEPETGYIHQ